MVCDGWRSLTGFDRVLLCVLLHFVADDVVEIETQFVGEHDAVDHDVGDFLVDVFQIVFAWLVVPLETFQQFRSFDAHGFGQVTGCMVLVPIALSDKGTDKVDG